MKRVGKRGEGKFEQISWDEAYDLIADNYQRILDEYGPEAIWNHYASGVNASNIGSFLSRFINMNGGCLGRYGSYSSAQISAYVPLGTGARAGRCKGHRHRSALQRHGGDAGRPVDPHSSRH